MSDLLSRLESRIRQAVEKIEEYQLEIDDLKERNAALEAERQEMHDKLASLIESFEALEAAADDAEESEDDREEIEASAEETETAEVEVTHHNSHNSVNSYAASPW